MGCLLHWNNTHGVGVTGTRTPAGQNDDHIAGLEESTSLTDIHCEVHPQVHILGPDIIRLFVVEYGEDAAVQVSLPGGLPITGHGYDWGAGPVP